MERLSTEQALVMLAQATESREREDAFRQAGLASLAAAASFGRSASTHSGDAGGDAPAAVTTAVLSELLAEVQALRSAVDGIRRRASST